MTLYRLLIVCLLLPILLSTGRDAFVLAGSPAAKPIYIEADRLESDQQQDVVVFTGRVQAKQDDVVIQADEMTVRYSASEAAAAPGKETGAGNGSDTEAGENTIARNISTILARGHVKIIKGDWHAVGDTMRYFADERKVELTGNAKAWQDQNTITGEHITLYLDEGRSVVERSGPKGERVKAFIYTDDTVGTR
jgi:lipopolysaccharide export system protein LptA